jgi:hypothetical protein
MTKPPTDTGAAQSWLFSRFHEMLRTKER